MGVERRENASNNSNRSELIDCSMRLRNWRKGCPVNITEITRVSLRNGYESHGFSYGSCGKRGFTNAPIADCRLNASQDDSLEIKPQWSSALVSPGLHAAVTLPGRQDLP